MGVCVVAVVLLCRRSSVDVPDVHGVWLLSDFRRRSAAIWTPVLTEVSSSFALTPPPHPFNGLFSRTTWVSRSRYQKGETVWV